MGNAKTTLKELRRRQRVVSSGADKGVAHRVDFSTCPECEHRDWQNATKLSHEEWMKRAVTLVLEPVIWKGGCVAVISECPKCFELSWVHQRFSSIYWATEWFPAEWRNRARKLSDTLKLEAEAQLSASLCTGCLHLKRPTTDYVPVWRDCLEGGVGIGPVIPKNESCEKFKPKNA